jgi:glycosyltransferase involved in cell wall biosynthesis
MGSGLNIAVNTRLLLEDKLEGIGWFTYETMKRITQQHPEHNFFFLFDRPYSEKFIFGKNVTPIVLFPQARHPFLYYLYFEYAIPATLKKIKADYFISPDGYMSLSTDVKTLNVIHDINFEHRPLDLPWLTRNYYKHYFPKFANKASRLATVSEYSKRDIVKSYKLSADKIDVVYNGCNMQYLPATEDEQKKTRYRFSNGRPYFLFVGSLNPRKNTKNLLLAFDDFKKSYSSDIKLLLAGEVMWDDSDFRDVYHNMKFKHDVHFLGRVPSSDLKNIIASALALTYVPFFEGFGIPILEAMYCDVPVITSNVTSMPEVAGEAGILVNPNHTYDIKESMLSIAQDNALRLGLIEKGRIQREKFSWDKTAEKLWNSFEKMISESKKV